MGETPYVLVKIGNLVRYVHPGMLGIELSKTRNINNLKKYVQKYGKKREWYDEDINETLKEAMSGPLRYDSTWPHYKGVEYFLNFDSKNKTISGRIAYGESTNDWIDELAKWEDAGWNITAVINYERAKQKEIEYGREFNFPDYWGVRR